MEDWNSLASGLGYQSETDMWQDLYISRGKTIAELGWAFKKGPATIIRRLSDAGVIRRSRGGPNNMKRVQKEEAE